MRHIKRFLKLLSVCVFMFLLGATVAGAHCMPSTPSTTVPTTTPTTVPTPTTVVTTPTTIPTPPSTLTPPTVVTTPTTVPVAPVVPSQPSNCTGGGFAGCTGEGENGGAGPGNGSSAIGNAVPGDASSNVQSPPTTQPPALAYTGVNVWPLLILGCGCVVGGLLLIRRRKMRA